MNKQFDIKLIGLFEIALIVLSGFAFAHLISKTNSLSGSLSVESQESKAISWIRQNVLNYLSKGLVSAQGSSIQTCLLDLQGNSCQEYPSEVCDAQCSTPCFPGRRTESTSCQIGTCYDPGNGLCNAGTPKASCESAGGQWSIQQPAQCNRECCLIGPDGSGGANQARMATQQQCNSLGRSLGAPVSWVPVSGELECLGKVRTNREGACVLGLIPELNKYDCRFTTQADCSTSGGTFYEGQLCTNPTLNTKCELTQNSKCFEEKYGVYYVDSCDNPANIYDSTKLSNRDYWSTVVPVSSSCSLGTNSNPLLNQQKCGNCDYLAGSTCGIPQSGVDKIPIYGQYVCKDLNCVDEDGTKRAQGESWCAFDGRIGLDGADGTNEERAVDVPGSRHYKKLCFDGEIRIEPCMEYRNGICVENDVGDTGVTTASCRINTGVLCLNQNEGEDKLAKCEEGPDCFLKHVELDKFKFDMCVPKYPTGFELGDESGSDSKVICGAATQTCTYYEKKGFDGRWSCKINCDCRDAKFAETMNNLCMSLGDCGGSVNLAGEYSKNYVLSGDKKPKVSQGYINGLQKYATPLRNQRVEALTGTELAAIFGASGDALKPDNVGKTLATFGLGAAGIFGYFVGAPGMLAAEIAANYGAFGEVLPTTLGGFSTALSGAAMGAGIGYILGIAFGLEGDQLTTATLVGAGAGLATSIVYGSYYGFLQAATFFFWAAVIVAVLVVILSILGIGKYRERQVTFECLPWQPPTGGANCEKCGENGLGCTEYKCSSLGKTCGFLNRGTNNEVCADTAPNDVSAPTIEFNPSALPSGFSSENVQSGLGVKIKKNSASNGCLQEYSPVTFGIKLNERGQCKISTERTENYEAMEEPFSSGDYDYLFNHTTTVAMPTLDELGISGVGPNRQGDYDLFIRCQDGSGNLNSNDQEYVVRFCVSPANDIQPPEINKFVPESPGLSGINSSVFNLQFYTDEPASCKFSSQDQAYETMEGDASCYNEISQSTLFGWLCAAQLDVSQISTTSNYYLRCADQPWLGFDVTSSSLLINSSRNVASESEVYEVQKTTTPLSITSVTPDGITINSGSQPVSVTMVVSTAGGMDNGNAFCRYTLNDRWTDNFFETSLSSHRQTWTSLFAGRHNVDLHCVDRAGNVANGNAQFDIVVDDTGPLITRVYNVGTNLQVITNEPSTCAYSTSSCSFDFVNGTILSGASYSHSMSYDNGLTYRIKCKDTFENMGTCLSVSGGY